MASRPQQTLSAPAAAAPGHSSSLTRAATRRKAKGYDIVHQGIRELYPNKKPDVFPTLDIVFVPGLGANPEESWKSGKTDFNWTTNPDGLQRDFPQARFLLYMYDSAWAGPLKVKQFMYNIAMGLLVGLRSQRENCQRRPIIFVGHSMGGLVIAKAITLADSRRDAFPTMFEAIAASIFFGTPFGGAPVAAVAAMYSQLAQKVDAATTSKLLEIMKPGDEELRQLKNDLLRLAAKSTPRIELLCFWETHPTDFTAFAGLPGLFGLTNLSIPKKYADFVNRDSATLPGIEELGLGCNHRDLVKFDGPKDERWTQMVRDPIKRIIHGAQSAVKNRFHSVRDIDQTLISGIMEALDGAQASKKRKILSQSSAPSSWIPNDAVFTEWLGQNDGGHNEHVGEDALLVDFLYIRGRQGRGKTSSTMAALNCVEGLIREYEEHNTGQDPVLLAYFFCDASAEFSTAEDILKSIIRQLITQQESLAPYAKVFAKKKSKDDSKYQSQQASITIENLWQSLQDMLSDEFIGSRVYFVLNNLHILPPESDSTIKLMRFISAELEGLYKAKRADDKRVLTRWLITSREAHNVDAVLGGIKGIRVIDLEDAKYENCVQSELRNHAKKMITELGVEKKYNKALTYFASSLIGKRAQNTQWIDITCVQLGELSDTESHLRVRRVLETMPQDLADLLNQSWLQIFRSLEANTVEKIKEMLRAIVLTFEDPTESELGILAGLASHEEEKVELRKLIDRCKPLLSLKRTSKNDFIVHFTNAVTRNHLRENAALLLGLSEEETKWQHGIIALRCFSHLRESFDFPAPEPPTNNPGHGADEQAADQDEDAENGQEIEADAASDEESEEEYSEFSESEDEYEDEDEEEEKDPEADILKDKALPYTVKHWLHHASKATLEIAEDLSLEEDFWRPGSIIRHRWMVEYSRLTTTLDGFDYKTMTGLHIAAALGFRQLVAALIRNGHESEIQERDSLVNSPLHFAAYLGRPNIVEELLNRGAVIDDAIEIHQQTPLCMASFSGHVNVMKKLLLRGANPNAQADEIGPVINAAISSGNRAAVELLVEHDVSFSLPSETDDTILSPLAMAAELADFSMFEYLVERYADRIPAENYSEALVRAASAGRLEVFHRLLAFDHDQQTFQSALDAAVEEWNWDVVKTLLEKRPELDCNGMFLEAATCSVPSDKVVEIAWRYAADNVPITAETLNDSLYHATDREKGSTVKLLLQECKADPNATGEDYGNALTAAAFDGNLEIVHLLIEAGADVNHADGWALQSAAAEGHYRIVEELLEHGADVNACASNDNFKQGTALQGACESGKASIVELLLGHDANPNLGTGPDAPPIVAAAMRGEDGIVSHLVQAKADLDVFGGSDLSTPLINAAAYLPQASLKLILNAGADINLPNNEGESALIVAARRGEVEAVTFLIESGADLMHSSKQGMNALQSAFHSQQYECMGVLVDRISVVLEAIKSAVDSGNHAVANLVRAADVSGQKLAYDDDDCGPPRSHVVFEAVNRPEAVESHIAVDGEGTCRQESEPMEMEASRDRRISGSWSVPVEQDLEATYDADRPEPSLMEQVMEGVFHQLGEHEPQGQTGDEIQTHPEATDAGQAKRRRAFSAYSPLDRGGQALQEPARDQDSARRPSWQSQDEELHLGDSIAQAASSYTLSNAPGQRVDSTVSPLIRRKPTPNRASASGGWASQYSQAGHALTEVPLQYTTTSHRTSIDANESLYSGATGRPQYQPYQPSQASGATSVAQPGRQQYASYVDQQAMAPQPQGPFAALSSRFEEAFLGGPDEEGERQGSGQRVKHRTSLFGMKNLLERF